MHTFISYFVLNWYSLRFPKICWQINFFPLCKIIEVNAINENFSLESYFPFFLINFIIRSILSINLLPDRLVYGSEECLIWGLVSRIVFTFCLFHSPVSPARSAAGKNLSFSLFVAYRKIYLLQQGSRVGNRAVYIFLADLKLLYRLLFFLATV